MKKIIINDKEYELLENFKEGFVQEEVASKLTDFFDEYDYILGDWAYGKLRLKGFNDVTNKNYRQINAIETKDKYLEEYCAYGCRYFIIKKSV